MLKSDIRPVTGYRLTYEATLNVKQLGFLMAASKSPALRLLHIRDEIDGMAAAVKGIDFSAYQSSYTLRRAAERAVQIISEAARTLPPELLARHSEAPWSAIIGVGISYDTSINALMIEGFGTSSPCICRSCAEPSRR
jgi:hypothetical protein